LAIDRVDDGVGGHGGDVHDDVGAFPAGLPGDLGDSVLLVGDDGDISAQGPWPRQGKSAHPRPGSSEAAIWPNASHDSRGIHGKTRHRVLVVVAAHFATGQLFSSAAGCANKWTLGPSRGHKSQTNLQRMWFLRIVEEPDGPWLCRRGPSVIDHHHDLDEAIEHLTAIATGMGPVRLLLHRLDGSVTDLGAV
jgi:hypothetical protein